MSHHTDDVYTIARRHVDQGSYVVMVPVTVDGEHTLFTRRAWLDDDAAALALHDSAAMRGAFAVAATGIARWRAHMLGHRLGHHG